MSDAAAHDTALSDLRVIDLTTNLSGPYCAMLLADQGADVIKVERPGRGDDMRSTPPFVGGESAPFMLFNRNKRSVTLDLKDPEGIAACIALIESADVVIENFRPGVAERLGIGYAAMAERNPRLVYASISGFGQTGPYRELGGFDLITQAMSGLMSVNGPPEGPPYRLPIAISDVASGMFCAYGVMTAIHARTRTGKGQHVDTSLLEAAISVGVYEASWYFATGTKPERLGQGHRGSAPYEIFPTTDGYVAVGASQESMWPTACRIIGCEHLIEDPRFVRKAERVKRQKELAATLAPYFAKESTDHWCKAFQAVGIPVGPVLDHEQVFNDPHVLARDMVAEIEHPAAGRAKVLGTPIKLSATPGGVRRPAPRLGEHTEEVLAEIAKRKQAAE